MADILVSVDEDERPKPMSSGERFIADIYGIFKVTDGADMIIKCEEKEFPCHKIILKARSPIFARGLVEGTDENRDGQWTVTDSTPALVEQMLQ